MLRCGQGNTATLMASDLSRQRAKSCGMWCIERSSENVRDPKENQQPETGHQMSQCLSAHQLQHPLISFGVCAQVGSTSGLRTGDPKKFYVKLDVLRNIWFSLDRNHPG